MHCCGVVAATQEELQGIPAIPATRSTVLFTKVHAEFVTAVHQLGEHEVLRSQLVVIGALRVCARMMTSMNNAPRSMLTRVCTC